MNTSQKSKWIVDAVLFNSFLLAFFLDLTGLALHQWLGMAIAAIAGYHLLDHDAWVTAVTRRFFGKIASRSRLYYLLDAALLVGLAAITVTGLGISTWLGLSLASYAAWRTVHIAASIVTLLVTVAKLALHGRWIVLTTNSIFAGQAQTLARPTPGAALFGRREFVRIMGALGIGATIALIRAVRGLQAGTEKGNTTSVSQDSSSAAASSASGSVSSASGSVSSASTTCTMRCRKECAFPGRCRRYQDGNANGRCDLGECA